MKKFTVISAFILFIVGLALIPNLPHAYTFADPDIFGKIDSPTGTFGQDPTRDIGNLIGLGIRLVFTVAGLACLFYMLWGAINWITSGGEQEKIQKAQMRIRNAVIGMMMVIVMFGLFIVIFGLVLNNKIIDTRNGFRFTIPSLDTINPGDICTPTPGNPC